MKTKIFHAEGVRQTGRRISFYTNGRRRKFALTETKDPHTGQPIRCVTELTNKGGEEDQWQRKRNLEKRAADPCPPIERPFI
jgi:hypothetical protein